MQKTRLAAGTLLGLLTISVIAAGGARGAVTTTAAEVYTGASPGTTLTTTETLTGSIKTGSTFVFESKVGKNLTPVRLTSTGLECKSCTIENKEVTSKTGKVAYGRGKVLFTGVTVSTPANCKVISEAGVTGQVITKGLVAHADFMNGTTAVQQFIPSAGAGTSFATFELENNGGNCSLAGLYSVTGTFFVDWETTGTFSTDHSAQASPAIESADGGGLFIGSQPADVYGTGVGSLGSGKEWTIK